MALRLEYLDFIGYTVRIMMLHKLPLKQVKIFAFFAAALLVVGTILFPLYLNPVYATSAADQQQLDELQKKIAAIQKQRQDLKGKLNSQKSISKQYGAQIVELNNEIQDLELSVQEKQLTIDELNLQIKTLQDNIAVTEQEIIHTQEKIDDLQTETDKRLADMYLDIKSFDNSISMIFNSDGESDFVKDGIYREAMQEETNSKLDELSLAKANLQKDEQQLQTDKTEVENNKLQIEEERKALESNQTDLAQKRSKYEALKKNSDTAAAAIAVEYNNLSDAEKQLQTELLLLEARIFNSVSKLPNGAKIKKGDPIGIEGNTGVSTGAHLHFGVQINGSWTNPCSVLPSRQLANASCGVSSPTIPQWPLNTSKTVWLTSSYGPRGSGFHYAIDVSTGGGAIVYAAHDGYITYGNDGACSWYHGVYPCNGKGANYAIICEDKNNCAHGKKTFYLHLR